MIVHNIFFCSAVSWQHGKNGSGWRCSTWSWSAVLLWTWHVKWNWRPWEINVSYRALYRQLLMFIFLIPEPFKISAIPSKGCLSVLQDLASVCEGQDPLHVHVLCRQCWNDSSFSCCCEQDPSTYGSNDERILAGELCSQMCFRALVHHIICFILNSLSYQGNIYILMFFDGFIDVHCYF